jgi:hypothetical protein
MRIMMIDPYFLKAETKYRGELLREIGSAPRRDKKAPWFQTVLGRSVSRRLRAREVWSA